jgi:putative inorganic carbon (HCO3(-)) transporter
MVSHMQPSFQHAAIANTAADDSESPWATCRSAMGKAERLLLGLIVLEISLQLDVNVFYREDAAAFGAIGGVNLSLTTVCLGVLYLGWIVRYAVESGYPGCPRLRLSLPLAIYCGIAALSLMVAQDRQLAAFDLFMLVQAFLLYTYVLNHVTTKDDIVFLVTMLMIALALQGAIMLGVRLVGHDVQVGIITAKIDDGRVAGTIGSPVTGASYLALLLAPSLAVLVTPLGRGHKRLALAALALGGMALLLTFTRGAWLALGLSFTVFLATAWYWRWISLRIPLTLAAVLLIVGAVFHGAIADRVFGEDEGSAHARIPLIKLALEIIGDHPQLGVGVNNCALVAAQYARESPFREEWFYSIHDKYLLVGVETGVVGLAAFLWFLLATLWAGWRGWQRQDRLLSPIALGLAAAVLGQMVHMTVDVFNSRPQVQGLWLCAALAAAICYVREGGCCARVSRPRSGATGGLSASVAAARVDKPPVAPRERGTVRKPATSEDN